MTIVTFTSRIRHSVLDRLQLSVAVASLHEPGVPLHLHHPRPHHRRVLHHHHRDHLEVRGAQEQYLAFVNFRRQGYFYFFQTK